MGGSQSFTDRTLDLAEAIREGIDGYDPSTMVEVIVRRNGEGREEVFVDESGNEGLRYDETGERPTIEGEGSPVSKVAQDVASAFLDRRVAPTQYEDPHGSETTIRA